LSCQRNRLLLVLVKTKGNALVLENLRNAGMDCTAFYQAVERSARFVARVNLNERVRPETPLGVNCFDLLLDIICLDRGE